MRLARSLGVVSAWGLVFGIGLLWPSLDAADIARLSSENWDQFVPQGKEVDCIYGDFVLRNNEFIVVIAQPQKGRNANMTVRNVGGMVIDMTRRDRQSDQLSCYYPGAAFVDYVSLDETKITVDGKPVSPTELKQTSGKSIEFACRSVVVPGRPQATNRYTLSDGQFYLASETVYENPHDEPITFELWDSIRADRYFEFGNDSQTGMFWAFDDWFRQAYGVIVEGREVKRDASNRGAILKLVKDDSTSVTLKKGETTKLVRKLLVADDTLDLRAQSYQLTKVSVHNVSVQVVDPVGPVKNCLLVARRGNSVYASGRVTREGKLDFALPSGQFTLVAEALGRESKSVPLTVPGPKDVTVQLGASGYVRVRVSDDKGLSIPCKVAFHGIGETKSPFFGPDGSAGGVRNVVYTSSGQFQVEMDPGSYDVVVSYGPEYDASFTKTKIERGKASDVTVQLKRTVDTAGWVSSDFHNHSSPSGDNASSQLGRVLNLLCEHIEFAPCTEHNRIDTYVPHLKSINAEHLMATCSGMELTGSPLPINHQNAFPLVYRPRTQDGGAPVTDEDPVVQIERLALWDNKSDKLLQQNHPNLFQILGDKDLDGQADGGFSKMFKFMDVVEVHPPEGIFTPPTRDDKGALARNPIFHWLQMLNLGYRIPGVVNTDAHYTYHDSGWLRNYLKCKTDDPAKIETIDMVHAAEKGNLIMTTGPFLQAEFTASSGGEKGRGGPGDDVTARGGRGTLSVRVQCPNWFDINRVQVFVNGRPDPKLNLTRRDNPDMFSNATLKFSQYLPIQVERDSHLIVATIGEGLELGTVFGETKGKLPPVAVSNPIFIDVDGNGFQANRDLLDVPLLIDKTETPK